MASYSTPLGLSEWLKPTRPNTGLHPPYPTTAELVSLFHNDTHNIPVSDKWKSVWVTSRKGEDLDAIHVRMSGLASAMVHVLDGSGDSERGGIGKHERVAVFGHVAPLIGLIRAFVESRRPIQMGVCSITTLKRLCENGEAETSAALGGEGAVVSAATVLPVKVKSRWAVDPLCSCSHLSGGESMPGGFEDPTWVFVRTPVQASPDSSLHCLQPSHPPAHTR
jgi:hypothetical protein